MVLVGIAPPRRVGGAAVKVTGAALMFAAAAYLLNPTLVDLGFYLEARKHELLAYTLIYAAGLIVISATVGAIRTGNLIGDVIASLTVGSFALLGLGIIFGSLAIAALLADEPNVWLALLALPSALCLRAALTWDSRKTAPTPPAQRWTIGRASASYVWAAAYFSISFAVGFVVLGAGYVLFRLLEANLIDGMDIHLGRVLSRAPDALWTVTVNFGPTLLLLGVAFALAIAAINFVGWALGGLFALLPRAEPRGLTHEEAAYIVRSEAAVRRYAEERGYSRFAAPIVGGALANTTVFVGLGAYFALHLHKWIPRPYSAEQLQGIGWHLYYNEPTNALLPIIFAFIGWSLLPFAVAYRLSPTFAEMYGWSGFGLKRANVSPAPYIEGMVHSGQLSLSRTFDPGNFLRDLNKSFEPYFFIPAVILTFIAAIIWHHDVSRYYLMTEDRIEVMNYWTLEKQRTTYAEVSDVILGCEFDSDDRPDLSYEIRLPNDFSIELLKIDELLRLYRVDGKIPGTVERLFGAGYDAHCIEKLAAGLPGFGGEMVREVFRVEEWHRRRWEKRISKPK